jgi:hypothetical protein
MTTDEFVLTKSCLSDFSSSKPGPFPAGNIFDCRRHAWRLNVSSICDDLSKPESARAESTVPTALSVWSGKMNAIELTAKP